jgi:hypothetical protein
MLLKPALGPKNALEEPVMLLKPAPEPANRLFNPAFDNTGITDIHITLAAKIDLLS